MPLTVTLDIGDDELEYFRSALRRSRARRNGRTPLEIATAATREVSRLRSTAHSPFIRRRIDQVERLVAMSGDPQWQLPAEARGRVLEALAYVAEARDLVPDGLPVLGLLDDAIMLELVLQDLRHELEAYEDFDAYRATEIAARGGALPAAAVSRQDWLDAKREQLHERMRQRRERDLEREGASLELITRF